MGSMVKLEKDIEMCKILDFIESTGDGLGHTFDMLPFAAKILGKKLKDFIPCVTFKTSAPIIMLTFLAEGNPGFSQIVALDVIKQIPSDERVCITLETVKKYLSNMDLSNDVLEKKWVEQKNQVMGYENGVDSPDYWMSELYNQKEML